MDSPQSSKVALMKLFLFVRFALCLSCIGSFGDMERVESRQPREPDSHLPGRRHICVSVTFKCRFLSCLFCCACCAGSWLLVTTSSLPALGVYIPEPIPSFASFASSPLLSLFLFFSYHTTSQTNLIMFFLPILMSLSALIAMLVPSIDPILATLPTLPTLPTLKFVGDPIGNIIELLHPAPVSYCIHRISPYTTDLIFTMHSTSGTRRSRLPSRPPPRRLSRPLQSPPLR